MAGRNLGRPWSEEEDVLLTTAVKLHGEQDNWKTIALSVPGRSNKACRKRWLHSLSPTIRKSAWTTDEDKQLLDLYNHHGPKWSTIAREIPGRTDDACSKRYREALDPNLKKGEWSAEEDERLMKLHDKFGEKWGLLGQELQRSGLGCRNRWRLLSRKASKVYYDAVNNQIPDLSDAQHRINSSQTDSSQPRPFQVDVLHQQSHWPPYYPPEAYSYLSHEDNATSDPGFRELTPEVVSHSPHEAPFNFSSSSLSAALSDPPRIPMSLPPTTECDPSASVELGYQDIHHQMSLDDLPVHLEEGQCHLSLILSRPCLGAEGGAQYNVSLFSPPIDTIRSMTNDGWDNFPADFLSLPVNEPFSLQVLDGLFTDPNLSDVSSTLSTPSHFPTSLSAVSSPNGDSPVELPGNDPRVVTSLLPADSRKQPPRTSSKKVPKKYVKPQGPARLSSMLALTPDPSVRPYACGRESCWATDAPTGSACFATSKELLDHCKHVHATDPVGDKPFKCALADCGKSWKSLNGLQYHLQLSTAHFRTALSKTFSQRAVVSTQRRTSSTPGSSTDTESGEETKRIHVCHHPGCFKAYRQPSGLRYHLKHGHPTVLPVQLSVVPPALARQMPSKTKKMRQKESTEDS